MLSPEHFDFPYPTPEEKDELLAKTGITSKQLTNWLTNARKRLWLPLRKKQGKPVKPYSKVKSERRFAEFDAMTRGAPPTDAAAASGVDDDVSPPPRKRARSQPQPQMPAASMGTLAAKAQALHTQVAQHVPPSLPEDPGNQAVWRTATPEGMLDSIRAELRDPTRVAAARDAHVTNGLGHLDVDEYMQRRLSHLSDDLARQRASLLARLQQIDEQQSAVGRAIREAHSATSHDDVAAALRGLADLVGSGSGTTPAGANHHQQAPNGWPSPARQFPGNGSELAASQGSEDPENAMLVLNLAQGLGRGRPSR